MNDKYIFLDIDGVLSPEKNKEQQNFCVEKLWNLLRDFQKNGDKNVLPYLISIFCEKRVESFKALLEKHDAKLVVHSSWTYFPGEEVTHLIFKEFGLDKFLADDWSTATKEHQSKANNIVNYINKNKVVEYIIIDDEFICKDLIARQIMPRTQNGLNMRHFNLIERFLKTYPSV